MLKHFSVICLQSAAVVNAVQVDMFDLSSFMNFDNFMTDFNENFNSLLTVESANDSYLD